MKEAATLIKRARKYMRSAQMLLEHKDYESCVSRTYYAMFYCAQAALVTKYLSKQFRPRSVEGWLEIPLDSAVAKGLKSCSHRGELPRWPGLKSLRPDISEAFQVFVSTQATLKGIARVHLDMYLWLENR